MQSESTIRKSAHKLTDRIVKLITELEVEYPEIYRFIDETPVNLEDKNLREEDLRSYLDTLEEQLNHYKSSHR